MERKKIERVRENVRDYDSKNGTMYVHMITIEGDNDEWEYHSITPECKKFSAGAEMDVITEIKQNGKYTNRRIIPVQQGVAPGGFNKKDMKNQDVITALSSASTAATFLNGVTKDTKELISVAEEVFKFANSKK